MLAVIQLRPGQEQGRGSGRRLSAPGIRDDRLTIGGTPGTSENRSRLPYQEIAELIRDGEMWRRGQEQGRNQEEPRRNLDLEEPRRSTPRSGRADQGGDSMAYSGSSRRRASERQEGREGGIRITSEERSRREDRKKYLRSNCPDTITPEGKGDQGVEQMRMFRWLQSMTEWMIEYGSCWIEPLDNKDRVRMFSDKLRGSAMSWLAGIREKKAAGREVTYDLLIAECKGRYCNMQDINRHAYEKLMKGDISMGKAEYMDPHTYLAAFHDVARAAGTHSGDHLGDRRMFPEGLDPATSRAVQWKGEEGSRVEVDNMEELYKRTENLIRTRALTVAGTGPGNLGYREPIKALKTEVLLTPGQATQQNNRAVEETSRQGRETSEGITRADVSNVAKEVLLRFLASQVTSYNPSFANAPSQAMNKIQETYQNAQERASGGPPRANARAAAGAGEEAGIANGEGSRQPPAASQASVQQLQQQQQMTGGGQYLGALLGQGVP